MRITSACSRSFWRGRCLNCIKEMRADPKPVAFGFTAAALLCAAGVFAAPAFTIAQASAPSSPRSTSTTVAAKSATSTIDKSAAPKSTAARSVSKRKPRQRTPTAPTSTRISEIQSALAAQGAYKGEPNGKWDDATSEAMKNYQSTHGLTPTGKLDALSLQKLGLGSDIAGRAAPLPQNRAPAAPYSTQQQTP